MSDPEFRRFAPRRGRCTTMMSKELMSAKNPISEITNIPEMP